MGRAVQFGDRLSRGASRCLHHPNHYWDLPMEFHLLKALPQLAKNLRLTWKVYMVCRGVVGVSLVDRAVLAR